MPATIGAVDERKRVGARLAEARKALGWTQQDFAHHANVSISSVTRWEQGKPPPLAELNRLADLLGIDVAELVIPTAPQAEPKPTVQQLRDEVAELRKLVDDLLARLPPGR